MTSTRMHPTRSWEMSRADKADGRARISNTAHGLIRVLSILALVGAACSSSAPATGPSDPPATGSGDGMTDTTPARTYALGEFPPFPDEPLPGSTAGALQAALDATIEDGTFTAVTAGVIVADRGSWAGAAGSADGIP
jgi:hypothetical protein